MNGTIIASKKAQNIAYSWKPISDLPANWQSLRDPELYSLADVWSEQKKQLETSRAIREFNERLLREWSIETGILEQLYTIDKGTTQLLIEQGIDAALIPHKATNIPVTELARIIQDHQDALEGIFDFVANRRELSISYIRELHQIITRHQKYVDAVDQFGNPVRLENEPGQWKKYPNSPTRADGLLHEYSPPVQVESEMDQLISMFRAHRNIGVPPEIEAAWLHHRFTQIHPFQDGNGRVARALTTIVFLQAGWFPVVINRDRRNAYLLALEAADRGDLQLFAGLFAQISKRAFKDALEKISEEDLVQDNAALPKVVDAVLDVYKSRRQTVEQSYQRVEALAQGLQDEIENILEQVVDKFQRQSSQLQLHITRSTPQNSYYYTAQIIKAAKQFSYWANVSRRRLWVRLHLFDPFSQQKTHIVFSFHYLGKENRGVMVSTGFIYFPDNQPDEDALAPAFGETHSISGEPFYFSYKNVDNADELKARFKIWAEKSVSTGLAEWAKRL